MPDRPLQLLVASDLHYVREAPNTCAIPKRRVELGRVLLRKTLLRLKHMGIQPDGLVLLGDLVDNGLADGAAKDMAALADEAKQAGLPVLALPGNHDGGGFDDAFDCRPGLHEIGGVGFLVFRDEVGAGDVTTRPADQLALPERVAAERPDLPLIALQHNPLHPRIESAYPYMPVNTDAILESYRRAGVMLSLSGHFHAGQPCSVFGNTRYYTVPALCEEPFRFALVTVAGRSAEVREISLAMDAPGLVDVHCHTEFAYCATTVNAEEDIAVSRALGLGGVCLTEHAFHLYFDRDGANAFAFQSDPSLARRAWAEGRGRMDAYRNRVAPLRNGFVRLGLEVDLMADGELLLAPGDAAGWDVLVGAVHELPGLKRGKGAPQDVAERLFMEHTERLLTKPIHVLAHPFRWFRRAGLSEPRHLYGWLADKLAVSGIAAEINCHQNTNDPDFIRECVKRGVKIALGTDAHNLAEAGELWPHLDVLEMAGVSQEQFPAILFP